MTLVSSSLRHRSFILIPLLWIVVIIAVNVVGAATSLESNSPHDNADNTNDEGIILHEEILGLEGGSLLQSVMVVVDEKKEATTTGVESREDSSSITPFSDPTTTTTTASETSSSIMTNNTTTSNEVILSATQRRKLQRASTKIIGGVDTRRGRFPYYVGLFDKRMTLICGGSLIASDVVITAAHCQ